MRKLALGSMFGFSMVLACAGLKQADDPTAGDDGGDDSGVIDGQGGDGSLEPPDAGPAPSDSECSGPSAWNKATKSAKECEARTVTVVDNEVVLETTSISIARTKTGRVGIVYYAGENIDQGEMRLAAFPAKTAPFVPVIFKRSNGAFSKAGFTTRIAASGNDTFEVLTHDVADTTGDVNQVSLIDGASAFTTPTLVASAIASPTQLTFANYDTDGALYATILKTKKLDGGVKGDLLAKRKEKNQPWAALADVVDGITLDFAPEVGSGTLLVDGSGTVHLAYHWSDGFNSSIPRYHTFDGVMWSPRKTIDNAVVDGLAGFSLRLALFGNTKRAVYYFKKAGQSAPQTSDLRMATWQGDLDMPSIEILGQSIASPDNPARLSAPPFHRVAMGVDKYGLVHLAMVSPSGGTQKTGSLSYRRQTRDATGTVKWLEDIIDDDVLANDQSAFVDMVIDEYARPHIAYRSGKDLKVYYATRTDR